MGTPLFAHTMDNDWRLADALAPVKPQTGAARAQIVLARQLRTPRHHRADRRRSAPVASATRHGQPFLSAPRPAEAGRASAGIEESCKATFL